MRPVKIFSDSTSDLSDEIIKHHDIGIIPLYVNFDQQSYKDGIDIDPAELFRIVEKTGMLPKTSAPTIRDFTTEFKKYIDKGMDVVHISISSMISASYQNACMAAAEFPEGRIKVIDSLNLSCGIGLLAMCATDCVENGMSLSETGNTVQSAISKVRSEFIIDTLEYLHKGGRCSGLQLLISSVLEIHPVITVNNGAMHVAAKIRGNRKVVLRALVNRIVNNPDRLDSKIMIVNNCVCSDDAVQVKTQFEGMNIFQQVLSANASCVIASHCGPKTLGLFYFEK